MHDICVAVVHPSLSAVACGSFGVIDLCCGYQSRCAAPLTFGCSMVHHLWPRHLWTICYMCCSLCLLVNTKVLELRHVVHHSWSTHLWTICYTCSCAHWCSNCESVNKLSSQVALEVHHLWLPWPLMNVLLLMCVHCDIVITIVLVNCRALEVHHLWHLSHLWTSCYSKCAPILQAILCNIVTHHIRIEICKVPKAFLFTVTIMTTIGKHMQSFGWINHQSLATQKMKNHFEYLRSSKNQTAQCTFDAC